MQPLTSFRIIRLGRYGEMVDTKDLKSFARLERPGSSPGGGTTNNKDYPLFHALYPPSRYIAELP